MLEATTVSRKSAIILATTGLKAWIKPRQGPLVANVKQTQRHVLPTRVTKEMYLVGQHCVFGLR